MANNTIVLLMGSCEQLLYKDSLQSYTSNLSHYLKIIFHYISTIRSVLFYYHTMEWTLLQRINLQQSRINWKSSDSQVQTTGIACNRSAVIMTAY